MRFICDKCKAKYSIADNKVQKKVLKIRCKKCSNVIIVRDPSSRQVDGSPGGAGPHAHAPASSPVAHTQAPAASIHHQNPYSSIQVTSSSASLPSASGYGEEERSERTVVARISADWLKQIHDEKQEEPVWFIALSGSPVGPIVLSEVQDHLKSGRANEQSLVWRAGWPDWIPSSRVPDLRTALRSNAPAPQPAAQRPAPQPAAQRPAPQRSAVQPTPFERKETPFQPKTSPSAEPAPQEFFAKSSIPAPSISDILDPFPKSAPKTEITQPTPDPFDFEPPEDLFAEPSLDQTNDDLPQIKMPEPTREPLRAEAPSRDLFKSDSKDNMGSPAAGGHVNRRTPSREEMPQPFAPVRTPQAQVPVNGQDVAMESQALPAELDQLHPPPLAESSEEEMFFASDLMSRGSVDNGVLEMTLPPLPEFDEPADDFEEFDVDDADIIEIKDTLKEKWTSRLVLGGGLLMLGLFALPFLFGSPLKKLGVVKGADNNLGKPMKRYTHKLTKEELALKRALLEGKSFVKKAPKKRRRRRRRLPGRVSPRISRKVAIISPITSKKTMSALEKAQLEAFNAANSRLGIKKKKSASGDIPKGLTRSMYKRILQTLESHMGKVKYCYENYLRKVVVQGRLLMELEIEPSGQVSGVSVLSRRFRGKPITKCIQRTMRQWRFDSFNGSESIRLQVPYDLKPVY